MPNTFWELIEESSKELEKQAVTTHANFPEGEGSHNFGHLRTWDLMDEAERDKMRLAAHRKASTGPIRNLREIFRDA